MSTYYRYHRIGMLILAAQTYDVARNGDATAKDSLGKFLSYGWISWSLMHLKWWKEGSLISTGKLLGMDSKGQVGGGIPCFALAALGITQFLVK